MQQHQKFCIMRKVRFAVQGEVQWSSSIFCTYFLLEFALGIVEGVSKIDDAGRGSDCAEPDH